MATCKVVLDTRQIDKKNEHNLAIEVNFGKNKCFLNIGKMTKDLYSEVFSKKSANNDNLDFKKECQEYLYRAEEIINDMLIFDRQLLRELFYNEKQSKNRDSLKVVDLFDNYFTDKSNLAVRTISKMNQSKNTIVGDNKEMTILEIDKDFLDDFQKTRLKLGNSDNYVSGIFRDLRAVINYFTKTKKIIPLNYKYPFGADGFKICNSFTKKDVLDEEDIKRFLNYNYFKNKQEEYARDTWELLYLCNGINYADLLRLRWDQKKDNCFKFFRKKTENTRKNHKQKIVVPITERIQNLLNKVGDTESQFVLGKLVDNYTAQYFENKLHKYQGKINKNLRAISIKLDLRIEMTLSKARDCYATTLNRNDIPISRISEMLGHSNTAVTQHYLGSMDIDKLFEVNSVLV
ncbi:tyrosine-type recombinase/integrase [Halpernia frigidisoli]|uniref:Phage integrase family protein n=1 Tax=Halpernia frigidisoli TaxID=1125876 RepID=A0A1I3FIT2_9FLAO|nr:tyrosine-type recombinase/integrase [Halpernia frigidisoli]SFI11086.1 Phage integrase family protein [Halpernia frigidisoli]